MLVVDFKSSRVGNLPEPFYQSLPEICPEDDCGYPMEILETLTGLKCSNPRCPAKVEQRLLALITQLGIKNFGESAIHKFIRYMSNFTDLLTPLLIFAYEYEVDGVIEGLSEDICARVCTDINEKKSFTLAEYVRIANIPGVQTSANSIFGKFDAINKAYAEIESGGIEFIQNCLGTTADVRAITVYNALMLYKPELFAFIDSVTIIPVNNGSICNVKACVTGDVGSFGTKAQYYAMINDISENVHVDFLSSLTKGVGYVIWEGGRDTSKIRKARQYQSEGLNIKIMSASEFVEEIKGLAGE